MSQKPNHDAKLIGARFRSARSLVPDLNRKSFCERYEINRYTMQSWENGLHVSKGKNVEKFIESLAREGVFCTSEWLIDGTGEPARMIKSSAAVHPYKDDLVNIEHSYRSSDKAYVGMLALLRATHENRGDEIIECQINDNDMAPKFMKGDTVIGIRISTDKPALLTQSCIVALAPDRLVVRKVLILKDHLLVSAIDEFLPAMILNLSTPTYEIVWHLLG